MTALTILSLAPALMNIHGDAENAEVFATRARWRGLDAEVISLRADDLNDIEPDFISIGAGFDADAPEVLAGLYGVQEALRAWVADGVPLLAVGLGWDLLSTSVEFASGAITPGIGVFSGRAIRSPRAVGTVAVETDWGIFTGYEYHLRDYVLGSDEQALGRVLGGVGNLHDTPAGTPRVEGAIRGNAVGTGLRGPFLARNPTLADHMLDRALKRRGLAIEVPSSVERVTADAYAAHANNIVLANMRLSR